MQYKQYEAVNINKELKEKNYDKIIENYIPMVLNIAKKFPAKYIEKDEAEAIGLLELIRCVYKIENLNFDSPEKITHYVYTCVYYKLRTTCKRRPRFAFELVDNLEQSYIDKSFLRIDIQDSIQQIIKEPIERKVLYKLFVKGHTQKEIAEKLKVSKQYITQIKQKVLSKLENELKNG